MANRCRLALFLVHLAAAEASVQLLRTDPGGDVLFTWHFNQTMNISSLNVSMETVAVVSCPDGLVGCEYFEGSNTEHFYVGSNIQERLAENSTISDNLTLSFGIRNVKETDAGIYTVSLNFDGFETVEKDLLVYVYQMPSEPSVIGVTQKYIRIGEEAKYSCLLAESRSLPEIYRNMSSLTYTWLLNGQATNISETGYQIAYMTKANNGLTLQCSVRDGDSRLVANSGVTELMVAYVDQVTFSNDDHGRLVCLADCNPACSYMWMDAEGKRANGSVLPNDFSRRGNVTCRASNSINKTTSASIFLYEVSSGELVGDTTIIIMAVFLVLLIIVVVILAYIVSIACRRAKHKELPSPYEMQTPKIVDNPTDPKESSNLARPGTIYDIIPEDHINPRYTPSPTGESSRIVEAEPYLAPEDLYDITELPESPTDNIDAYGNKRRPSAGKIRPKSVFPPGYSYS